MELTDGEYDWWESQRTGSYVKLSENEVYLAPAGSDLLSAAMRSKFTFSGDRTGGGPVRFYTD